MKISGKKIFCVAMTLLLALQLCSVFAGCNPQGIDAETTPLVISTEPVDGVFNPFSYTSGADGGVIGVTQLSMLNIDKDGKIVAGWDQPTVAEGYSVVNHGTESDYDRDGNYDNYYTDYYFAIKDGIKFSDGQPLTIKDILFNMYVYLDPLYTGSSTMYSIAIQGLSAYRTQSADDNAQDNLNQLVQSNASMRLERLITWCQDYAKTPLDQYFTDPEELQEVRDDITKIKELFRQELETDWVAAASSIEEYEKYYLKTSATDAITTGAAWKNYTAEGNTNKHVTEQWEIFLIMYNQITTGVEKLDDGTKKYTFEYNGSDNYDHSKDSLVNRVFTDFFPQDETTDTFRNKLLSVITQYQTSNTFFEYAMTDERGKILNEGDILYDNISGITVYKSNNIPASAVSGGSTSFDGDRYILKIRINGVDPKALLSFSFSVAPMHYYSTPEAIAEFVFNEEATAQDEDGHTLIECKGFGVKYSDSKFMDNVNTNLVPRGAGPYRPSNGTLQGVAEDATVSVAQFNSNNIINFERNDYFKTCFKTDDAHNAYIKFLRYKVIASNAMVNAVTGANPEVFISMPTATSKVNEEIRKLQNVKAITVDYMGYGYIGINASFVKDLNVRRAIMHAMNVELCTAYYGSDDLVEIIYRSMSKNSWAYPEGCEAYYKFDETGKTSLELVQEAGYSVDARTGILTNADGETLKFTFTVAGETEDHPAYQTMNKAKDILNSIGFDVEVTKDSQALSKLASGGLQVWAAAWSSSVDPDMYQVYHKDSTASSVRNWGYSYLLREGSQDELDILDQLAEQIELGRKYLTEDQRKPYYEAALDLVMDLAVELPTYQRKEMYLIKTDVVDVNTLSEATVYQSPVGEIWNINFVNAG